MLTPGSRPASEPREPRRRFMITGEHVILRAFEREDAERCYRWMNDPNIVRTLKGRYPIAFQTEVEWLERAMQPGSAERHFAIERKEDRVHIGNASIHDIDWVSRAGWFGLFIGEPSAWNRGFGTDSIQTLVRFAFDEMNLRKLRINVFEYNDRAKHVLLAKGFREEGRLVRDFYREGSYHDIVILSVFRDDEPQETGACQTRRSAY
ncbi:MAG: GNAT family protein [Thermoanaerobaculia bacterium]